MYWFSRFPFFIVVFISSLLLAACHGEPPEDDNAPFQAGTDVTTQTESDSSIINGQLTASDSATFTISTGHTAPAGFNLNSDGHYSFDPSVASYNSLNVGESVVLTIPVTVTDEEGATDTLQIQITVLGSNNIPVALDDSYDTFGNTLLEVGVGSGGNIAVTVNGSVLDNDTDLDVTDSLSVTLETPPVHGSLNINAQGQFTYTPLVGQTLVTDSFSYRVSDGSSTDTATVSINITERIWYVDNTNSGDGTSVDPFASLMEAELVLADGDTLYIRQGDGSSSGMDDGLTLSIPNVDVIGEGTDLVIDGTTLASAGSAPIITNASGNGVTLNAADNTLMMGLTIDGATFDGLLVNDATGVMLEMVNISNSGQSAIQGEGADVGLNLTEVTITNVDVTDSSVSDDAISIAVSNSVSLVINEGSITGVPGNLGDGIEIENADASNAVSMSLDIRGVTFSDIEQDGIKLDNDNGVMNVQIGGDTDAEGNNFDVGFRGIHIQTDEDPTLGRTNTILIQNNVINSVNESIQVRHIKDLGNLSILDNTVNRNVPANISDLIDVQVELNAVSQARINRNDINNLGGSDGVKLRVFDASTLTAELLNNSIEGPDEGFDFDVIETDGASLNPTTLNVTVLNNTLESIGAVAMKARNADTTSTTCMDLQSNSAVADYELNAVTGSFSLTSASQVIVFNPAGGSFSDPGSCSVPIF